MFTVNLLELHLVPKRLGSQSNITVKIKALISQLLKLSV